VSQGDCVRPITNQRLLVLFSLEVFWQTCGSHARRLSLCVLELARETIEGGGGRGGLCDAPAWLKVFFAACVRARARTVVGGAWGLCFPDGVEGLFSQFDAEDAQFLTGSLWGSRISFPNPISELVSPKSSGPRAREATICAPRNRSQLLRFFCAAQDGAYHFFHSKRAEQEE
jgi:hypothetical protein